MLSQRLKKGARTEIIILSDYMVFLNFVFLKKTFRILILSGAIYSILFI